MFFASKLFYFLARPSMVVVLLLVVGMGMLLTRRYDRWAHRTLIAGIALLLVCGFSPLANILTLPLEQRFIRPELPNEIGGIIVLGGYEDPVVSTGRGQLTVNDRAERLTETLLLARRYPNARVIVSGGAVDPLTGAVGDAAGPVGAYLREAGIGGERIVLEGHSRTTYENALLTRQLIEPKPNMPYVLVTSAVHMPRSIGVFRRQGYEVLPWPVDYRTAGVRDVWLWFDSLPTGLKQVDEAFKEWVGLLAYRLAGRSDALFPGPRGI
ncbi:MAG: YdcF family protein [Hyphomicrobiaceae bacterium]